MNNTDTDTEAWRTSALAANPSRTDEINELAYTLWLQRCHVVMLIDGLAGLLLTSTWG